MGGKKMTILLEAALARSDRAGVQIVMNEGTAMSLKIPYGKANFESIVSNDFLYLDKTAYIEKLENLGASYVCFFRPRRFGKSLFISMLEYYYDCFYQDRFDTLFHHLAIGKRPTKLKNSYHVLRFDFSGIVSDDLASVRTGFNTNVMAGISYFNAKYQILSPAEMTSLKNQAYPGNILSEFLGYIQGRLAHKIYILIDEYDHFANDLLAFDRHKFSEVMMGRGFVRKFYEVIKSGAAHSIDRVFITGVTPLTLDSLTSGFNIDANMSQDLWFHDMLGLTRDEVQYALALMASAGQPHQPSMLDEISEYYNGYLFHKNAPKKLFNTDMLLYFLGYYARFGKPPEKLLDTNIISDYKKLREIFSIGNREQNFIILQEIMTEQRVTANLIDSYNLEKQDFSRDEFISLLYYLGLLTIAAPLGGRIEFRIPNLVIKKLYYEYFIRALFDQLHFSTNELLNTIEEAIYELAYRQKIQPIVQLVEEFLGAMSNRDWQKFDEKYIKLAFMLYLSHSQTYLVKSEYEIGQHYIDILLLGNPALTQPQEYAMEFKYLKKNDATAEKIEQKCQEGQCQLRGYLASPEGQKRVGLQGYLLLFVGACCKRLEKVEI
jgi:hypothetical protein